MFIYFDYLYCPMKNRTLFYLSFCLDATASSAQVQKNEKIKSLIILQFTPLLKYDRFSDLYELLYGALISIRFTLSE